MTDNFQGIDHIELQPGDINYPASFRFVAASASTANDGSIPYGSSIHKVVSTIKDRNKGIDATTSIIASSALSGNVVTVYLNHSSDVADGEYILTTKVSIALSGSTTTIFTREFDFRRINLRNE